MKLTYDEFVTSNFEVYLSYLITFYYVLDILLNFNTGFFINGELVRDYHQIFLKYIKLWFWIDLFTTIPYQDIVTLIDSSQNGNMVKVLRMLKFLRLIR